MHPIAAERRHTPNFVRGREGHAPRGIVLHTTAGTYESTVRWFGDPGSGVSAHYLVGLGGRLAQFVKEEDTARHAGRVADATAELVTDGNPNLYTIGIEFEDGGDPHRVQRPDAQYRTGAELLRDIAARWDIPLDERHVVRHRDIYVHKSCPGNLDVDRLLREARST